MFGQESPRVPSWAVAAGAAASATALAYSVLRVARSRRAPKRLAGLEALEEEAVDALRRDPVTGACAIDVAALAPGIIELTGVVPTHDAGQRAARLLHALTGVRTVVNRLDEGSVEEQLAFSRVRRASGDAASRERHWYGVRVGMGRRRQSPETEPARPDDSVERRTRELEVSQAEITEATAPRAAQHGDDAQEGQPR